MKANKKIKPIWVHYKNWECYKNDMYKNGHDLKTIKECYNILTSKKLKKEMEETTKKYKISTKVNFTNQMFNPVSWLGQATCNRLKNAKAQETCEAWMMMSKEQQNCANNIAKEVIEEWRNKYENIQ